MAGFLDTVVATALPAHAGATHSIGNATCRTLTPSCSSPWLCSLCFAREAGHLGIFRLVGVLMGFILATVWTEGWRSNEANLHGYVRGLLLRRLLSLCMRCDWEGSFSP